jgi:hypothetical protein
MYATRSTRLETRSMIADRYKVDSFESVVVSRAGYV